MNAVDLSLFASRVAAICEEMGAVLQRAAFSTNIKDRLDFSCAVFDAQGELCAQAAHIPVHLGSMAFAMRDIVRRIRWHAGDMVVLNDPYLGGTHLPDVTVIAPVYAGENLVGFVANRAHHADIGAATPGSMPITGRLDEEGLIIPPSYLMNGGRVNEALLAKIAGVAQQTYAGYGDFAAQMSANRSGVQRVGELIAAMGKAQYQQALAALNDYAERLARSALQTIPHGTYRYRDFMDDDGLGNEDIAIEAAISVDPRAIHVDFRGTAEQTPGNINCPLSVAAAAVYYVFRCLMPEHTPACAGSFRPIALSAPEGCLVNARRPAAVAAGNVETSTRIVDVVMGALAQAMPDRIPAASHGSMNNVAVGAHDASEGWDYYETIGGGMGGGPNRAGLSAVQTHMTNTLNTPIESLEMHYPLRILRYEIRDGSGGFGINRGGDGIVREFELLAPATVTLLTERRRHAPWGLNGGQAAERGCNLRNDVELPGKVSTDLQPGERLTIMTAGGGGWGAP